MASSASLVPVPPVDFAILTALPEERDALLAHLPDARPLDKLEGDVATVLAVELATSRSDRAAYRVVVTCLGAMGPIAAATRAATIARRWKPRRVLMVGIAGGVAGEAELGDVLVASQIADYTVSKDRAEERSVRWQVYPADPGLLDSAVQLATGWDASIGVPRPSIGIPSRRIGVIASGGDVIARAALARLEQRLDEALGRPRRTRRCLHRSGSPRRRGTLRSARAGGGSRSAPGGEVGRPGLRGALGHPWRRAHPPGYQTLEPISR